MPKHNNARAGRDIYEAVAKTLKEEWFTKISVPDPMPEDLGATFERVARRVYSLGLPPWVLDRHWEATRAALHGCDPERVAGLTDREAADILDAPDVLRNGAKLAAVRHNAQVLCALTETYGDLASYRDALCTDGVQPLLDDLRDRLRLVGPVSAARIAQELGADCLVPHPAVLRTSVRLGWTDRDADPAARQQAASRAAAKLPRPFPVARLGAALLAFSTGRWGAESFCEEAPQCSVCPVWANCARVGVEAVDAA